MSKLRVSTALSLSPSCKFKKQTFGRGLHVERGRHVELVLRPDLNPDGRVGATRIVPSDGSALAAAALASESGAFHVTR